MSPCSPARPRAKTRAPVHPRPCTPSLTAAGESGEGNDASARVYRSLTTANRLLSATAQRSTPPAMSSPSTSALPFADPLWHTRRASPYYTPSHVRLQREARAYVSTHIAPFCAAWEAAGRIPPAALARHAAEGYAAAAVYPLAPQRFLPPGQRLPADVPPEEWDAFHDLIVIDEIARCGCLGVVWGLACGNAIGVPPLVNFGSEEQKRRFLPGVLGGQTRFCLGVTEPDGECLSQGWRMRVEWRLTEVV